MVMKRDLTLSVLLSALVGIVAHIVFRKEDTREFGMAWPVSFAHRGDSCNAPENTLESFRRAISAGAGGLELDVHMTLDGEIVVIHDDTLSRTTEGTGYVRQKTLAEIKHLDAGYHYTEGGSYPYRGKGLRVLTLAEVFSEFPDVAVNVEIKEDLPGIETAVSRVIRDNGARDRMMVASGRHRVIKRFRKVSEGTVATSASELEIWAFYFISRLHLESIFRPPYEALQIPVVYGGVKVAIPRFVEAAHDRGIRVDVWTINEPGEMNRLLDLGVDVIMTNRPAALQQVLEQRRESKV